MACRIGHNLLINSIAEFNPLANQIPQDVPSHLDTVTTKSYGNRYGFMATDAKHAIFLSLPRLGKGVKSAIAT